MKKIIAITVLLLTISIFAFASPVVDANMLQKAIVGNYCKIGFTNQAILSEAGLSTYGISDSDIVQLNNRAQLSGYIPGNNTAIYTNNIGSLYYSVVSNLPVVLTLSVSEELTNQSNSSSVIATYLLDPSNPVADSNTFSVDLNSDGGYKILSFPFIVYVKESGYVVAAQGNYVGTIMMSITTNE